MTRTQYATQTFPRDLERFAESMLPAHGNWIGRDLGDLAGACARLLPRWARALTTAKWRFVPAPEPPSWSDWGGTNTSFNRYSTWTARS